MHNNLYDTDFCEWASLNAIALQEKRFEDLDCKNLIEELRLMGISEKRALVSCLSQLLLHLLKWQFQPTHQCISWKISITKQRKDLIKLLKQSPGLKSKIDSFLKEAFEDSLTEAQVQTGLSAKAFPEKCPYTFEQLMDDEFYPE